MDENLVLLSFKLFDILESTFSFIITCVYIFAFYADVPIFAKAFFMWHFFLGFLKNTLWAYHSVLPNSELD